MKPAQRTRPRLRFIPFRKRDVVEMCLASGGLDIRDQMKFRQFCHVLQSVYHFEYHDRLEALKDSYAPINPDRDTRKIGIYREEGESRFVDVLDELLNKANYERFSDEELKDAMQESTLFKLRLHIDFGEFEEVLLYTRGESMRDDEVKYLFGLIRKPITFANFDRVVIYVKFSENLNTKRSPHKPGSTMLKLFRDVPRADVEMLFPNTRVGMRLIDKLAIGIPALLGSGAVLTTQIGTSLLLLGALIGYYLGLSADPVELDRATLLLLAAGIGGIVSYIWKQFVNFKNRKLTFLQSLMENLYFKNLDNNAGVFHRLVDDAEEEECKEAIIGYYFLLTRPEDNSARSLDEAVEAWFKERWDSEVDFEVEDALDKLRELGLVEGDDDNLTATSLPVACERLDQRWDAYFAFPNESAHGNL